MSLRPGFLVWVGLASTWPQPAFVTPPKVPCMGRPQSEKHRKVGTVGRAFAPCKSIDFLQPRLVRAQTVTTKRESFEIIKCDRMSFPIHGCHPTALCGACNAFEKTGRGLQTLTGDSKFQEGRLQTLMGGLQTDGGLALFREGDSKL